MHPVPRCPSASYLAQVELHALRTFLSTTIEFLKKQNVSYNDEVWWEWSIEGCAIDFYRVTIKCLMKMIMVMEWILVKWYVATLNLSPSLLPSLQPIFATVCGEEDKELFCTTEEGLQLISFLENNLSTIATGKMVCNIMHYFAMMSHDVT